jgi:hypothetical protein
MNTIRIPLKFLLANPRLSWEDIRYGLEKRHIDEGDVIGLAMDYVSRSDNGSPLEIELAGLFQNEQLRVAELLTELAADQETQESAKDTWLYLLLAWLYEQRESFDDPLAMIEQIYSDYDYPEEMACFVRYMPPSDGYRPQDHTAAENHERLLRLWHDFLLKHRPA